MEHPQVVVRIDGEAADLPVTHLLGSACDQSGSGSNSGTCCRADCAAADCSNRVATTPTATVTAQTAAMTIVFVLICHLFARDVRFRR